MIPVWTEDQCELSKWCFGANVKERCIFCNTATDTWHENTNNPVCVKCAKTHKVSDIEDDHGCNIRARKRKGTFNRGNSVRAN
jgi:hypothetical protein